MRLETTNLRHRSTIIIRPLVAISVYQRFDVVTVVVNGEMPLKSVVVEQWTNQCAPNKNKLAKLGDAIAISNLKLSPH